ncbi:hypothetical protein KKH23_09365 [Patescibacteria group bacterium]|nr:hypothetical protein [Patescibacteria group bacterium]
MIMAVQQKVKTKEKHECPPHYWIINSENVGHCRYCPEVRDFGSLLQKAGVFVAAGRRGAKASKGVPRRPYNSRVGRKEKEPANARISAAAKKRWQDPEYRAKMSDRKGRKLKYG